jgi:5-methylcytosine-specific restriction endonuclease McrA
MKCRFCSEKLPGNKQRCVPFDPWFHHNHLTHLGSNKWQETRTAVMAERGAKCERCGWCFDIEVHHLNYCRLGAERMSDLMILCSDCHEKTHRLHAQKAALGKIKNG